jgi:hypothetical protein
MSLDSVLSNKKQYFLALGTGTIIYFLSARYFQNWLYHYMGIDGRPVGLFLSFGPTFMQAEPFEAPLYVLSYLVVPTLALVLVPLVSRIRKKHLIGLSLIALLGAGAVVLKKLSSLIKLGALLSLVEKKGIWHILWLLTTKRILVAHAVLLLSGLFVAGFYFLGKYNTKFYSHERTEKFFRRFWPVLVIILGILIFNPSFPLDTHHFNYYLGAVNDVYHGKAMLYESSHLYGLLDVYLLAGVFKLIPMTYPMLALIITVCYFLLFIGIFLFARLWLKSYTLASLATATIVSILYFFQNSFSRSVLFFPGMSPFRWGLYLPTLLAIYQYSKTLKPKFMHVALALSAVAIFWNFDSGLYLTVATVATLIYRELAHNWDLKRVLKIILFYGLYAVGLFAAINLINHGIYGGWPDWHLFLKETKYFTQGAGMYPLPPIGLYELFYFSYLVVLLVAVYRLWKKEPMIDMPLFFLGAFGATSLIYYVGESTWQLLYVVTVPFILIVFYAFKYVQDREGPSDSGKLISGAFFGLLVYALLLFCFKLPVEFSVRQYATMRQNLLGVRPEDQSTYQDAKFVSQNFATERIPIMSKNDTKFLIYADKANYFDFYYTFTIYFQSEMDKYIRQVRQNRLPVVLVGRDAYRNDQVEYFLRGIQSSYHLQRSLQTVDIYVLNQINQL